MKYLRDSGPDCKGTGLEKGVQTVCPIIFFEGGALELVGKGYVNLFNDGVCSWFLNHTRALLNTITGEKLLKFDANAYFPVVVMTTQGQG